MTIENILSFGLVKGGVGKTSLVCNVAGLMAHAAQRRTLIIDLDPQANTRLDLGVGKDPTKGEALANAILTGNPIPITREVRPRLDLSLGGSELGHIAKEAETRTARGGQPLSATLEQSIAAVADDYDLVVVDTAPGETLLGTAALSIARSLVIPTKADAASIAGLEEMGERVALARQRNPDLVVLGLMFFGIGSGSTRIKEAATAQVRKLLGTSVPIFEHSIRHTEAGAWDARAKGRLAYELSKDVADTDRFAALRNGNIIDLRSTSSTSEGLAGDYENVVKEILGAMAYMPPMTTGERV